jgi:hypothetical protein
VILGGLGINDGLAGREALAELLTYADFVNSSLRGLKKLLGLYKPIKSSRREYWRLYDGRLHRAVTRLAMAYYKNRPSGRHCWELVKKIKQLVVTFSGTRISPRQRGEKPQNYTHRGLTYYNRWRISPAGYIFIIPVSGVPRLAAGAYRLINPHSFLRLSGLGFVLRFNSFLKIFAGNLSPCDPLYPHGPLLQC